MMNLKANEWVSFEGGYIDFDDNKIACNVYFQNESTGDFVQMDNDLEEVWDSNNDSLMANMFALEWFRDNQHAIKTVTRDGYWEEQK
jgi:hypothetical protein